MIITLLSDVLHAVTLRRKSFILRKVCSFDNMRWWTKLGDCQCWYMNTDKWIPRNMLPFSESALSISSNNQHYHCATHITQESRAATQAPGHRPLTSEARINSRPVHVSFVVDEVLLEQMFFKILRLSLVTIIPPMSDTHLPFTEDLSYKLRVLTRSLFIAQAEI